MTRGLEGPVRACAPVVAMPQCATLYPLFQWAAPFCKGRVMQRWVVFLAIMLFPLLVPPAGLTQFLPHVDGSQRGVQDNLTQEQLKLQNVEQRRHIREAEFQAEVEAWATAVQVWRELTGQPPLSQDQLRRKLDVLRVFDWERQYQEAWVNK
jgi:hypothetical protein